MMGLSKSMLGVGRKPPSVLRQHSTKRLTYGQSGQLISTV